MSDPVSSIRNLGPMMDEACARAGIMDAAALRALGTDAAYLRLLRTGTKAHFIGYYVLEMALQGRPWNDCKGAEKAALKTRFEALKREAAAAGPVGDGLPRELAEALDALGVRA